MGWTREQLRDYERRQAAGRAARLAARMLAEAAGARREGHADARGLRPDVGAQPPRPLGRQAQVALPCGRGARGLWRVVVTCYACNPQDCDNLGGSYKELVDAMKDAGWFPDDDWRTLECEFRTRKAATRREQRTVVELTRVA